MEPDNQKIQLRFPEYYPKQFEVFETLVKSDYKTIVVNGSRQVGKTKLLIGSGLYLALSKPNQKIMITSSSDSQVEALQKDMIAMLSNAYGSVVNNSRTQSGKGCLDFTNGSSILFRSANSSALRGYTLTALLMDETAFCSEESFRNELEPSLSVGGKNGGKILLCSTARGDNFFKKLYVDGLKENKHIKSFKLLYVDNPYADLEFIEERRRILPAQIFSSEYMGEFTEGGDSIFKHINEACSLSEAVVRVENKRVEEDFTLGKLNVERRAGVIGFDVAFETDFSVGIAYSESNEMLDMIRFNKVDVEQMVKSFTNFCIKWNPRKILIENNNQGKPVFQLLQKALSDSIIGSGCLEEFNTNSKTKPEIINFLISKFSNKEIKLWDNAVIRKEFTDFSYSINKSGSISFAATNGNHDDIVMSTAIAVWGNKSFEESKLYFY